MLLSQSLGQTFRQFVHEHDEIPAFHAAYLVAVFLSAAILNLGFFLVLILVHFFLDLIKYAEIQKYSFKHTVRAACLENLFDLTLFFIAITFYVYFHNAYIFFALGGLSRSAIALVLIVTTLLPKMGILDDILGIFLHINQHLHFATVSAFAPLRTVQKVMIAMIIISIVFLAYAPVVYGMHDVNLMRVLSLELIPWML